MVSGGQVLSEDRQTHQAQLATPRTRDPLQGHRRDNSKEPDRVGRPLGSSRHDRGAGAHRRLLRHRAAGSGQHRADRAAHPVRRLAERSFYARPTPGLPQTPAPDRTGFDRVLARQRMLRQPQSFEWIHDVHPPWPTRRDRRARVQLLPLMVLRGESTGAIPAGYSVRILAADDPELPSTLAAIGLSYGTPGTAVGPVGSAERDAATTPDEHHESAYADIRDGRTVLAIAADRTGPIGGGSHSPRGGVTEITGVGTLPAHRRRGLGAAVTHALAADAAAHGVDLCFLTAGSTEIARVCAGVGFVRIGSSGIAEPIQPAG